ncbi:MAG: DMT family transporter [Acidimicrobiales bacterium]
MTPRGLLLFAALGVIWGLPYLLIRVAVREVSPELLVFVRTAGGALLLVPFAWRRGMLRPLAAHWQAVLAYSVVEIGVPWLLLFRAERRVTSSLAGLLVTAVPMVGAVLARLSGTEHFDRRRMAGLALGIIGVAALVGFDVHGSSLWAALSLEVVAVGYALGPWVIARYLSDVPAMSVIAASLVICGVGYAPLAAINLPSRSLSGSVVLSMVGLTVLCTALAFVLFFALIAEIGPVRATVITYVNPAVAVLLGVTVLGEHFGAATAVGFVLILGGSYLATRATPSQGASIPPTPTVAES